MGANKDDRQEVEMSEEQQSLYEDTLMTVRALVDDISASGTPIREFALAFTKLEEAEMWLARGFDQLGIEPDLGEDEDESEEDDEDEKGDESGDEEE